MSGKINVAGIIVAHLKTMRDHGRDKFSIIDGTVFFVCPGFIASVIFVGCFPLSTSLVGSLINGAAILLGLLLNLLVLMFDQKNKASDAISKLDIKVPDYEGRKGRLELRCVVINESVANISFTILMCVISLCTLLIFSAGDQFRVVGLWERSVYAANSFIWSNVSLTILMIIKRVFALFSQE
ncbi:hypothetical protein L3067_18465 [Xanthomonas sp. PPL568]|uniref:hypothetical protein n=1 Tax=Xanthomonas indica TaxID=2912242 RepID=UPI001F55D449|nr:hypothetical protein [Xanthomonas indica]MCI2246600.1 hypothetical protein [Xanthomonas indica]